MILYLSSCSQLQEAQMGKARDNIRIQEMKLIESALHMLYDDNNKYPESLDDIIKYTWRLPKDPKDGLTINGNYFSYTYETQKDSEWIISSFRLSTYLESKSNTNRLTMDNGIYDDKFEKFN